MEKRRLGGSDVRVSPVIFGAWAVGGTFWGGSDDKQAVAAIRAAVDAGISAIDTAPVYGFGRSERIVGEAIKGRRDEVVVATKCGQRWDSAEGHYAFSQIDEFGNEYSNYITTRPESIIEECEGSLKRLGVDVIDLYQVHVWDRETPPEDFMGALVRLKEQGKIRAIGISGVPFDELRRCVEIGPVASVQPRFNILDREIEQDVLPLCREHGVGVIVYSPLERGLLTGKITLDREFPEGDSRTKGPLFDRKNRQRVLDAIEKIRPIAEAYDATPAQVMANWVFGTPGVTAAIVGARNPEQARENAGAMSFVLTTEDREHIEDAFRDIERYLVKLRARMRKAKAGRRRELKPGEKWYA